MLSSKDGLFDKARGRMVGSEDYLTKPFTKDQLLQAVNSTGRLAALDAIGCLTLFAAGPAALRLRRAWLRD